MNRTDELRLRTKQFALRIIKLAEALPRTSTARVIGNQIVRSGTSVGANYCSACRARSKSEFVAKIGIALEEADETVYWLELLTDTAMVEPRRLQGLLSEAEQLVSILAASRITASRSLNKS